jgi:hypothetical protein
MTTIQLAATPAQHESTANQMTKPDHGRNREMVLKAWRVINSCQTPRQARGAMIYLDLLEDRYPDLDVSHLRRELRILFEI